MKERTKKPKKPTLRQQLDACKDESANLKVALDMSGELSKWQGERLREYADFFEFVALHVGRHALVAGIATELQFALRDRDRMPVLLSVSEVPDFSVIQELSFSTCREEVMRLIEVGAVRDQLKRELHVMVKIGEQQKVGYAISESALRSMSSGQLQYTVHRQLGPLVALELKKAYR